MTGDSFYRKMCLIDRQRRDSWTLSVGPSPDDLVGPNFVRNIDACHPGPRPLYTVDSVGYLNLELMTLSSDIVSAHALLCRACKWIPQSTGAQTGANRDDGHGTDMTRPEDSHMTSNKHTI